MRIAASSDRLQTRKKDHPSSSLVETTAWRRLTTRDTAAGTAAYLDVFGSILAVAKELKGRGYDLGDVDPAQMEAEDLMDMVLNDKEAKFDSCDLGVPRCCGAFTPSTRVVSRRGGGGWFLF